MSELEGDFEKVEGHQKGDGHRQVETCPGVTDPLLRGHQGALSAKPLTCEKANPLSGPERPLHLPTKHPPELYRTAGEAAKALCEVEIPHSWTNISDNAIFEIVLRGKAWQYNLQKGYCLYFSMLMEHMSHLINPYNNNASAVEPGVEPGL
ncbi:hsp90 co-chaperone cdc37-like 1 [Limosa lapponica baueri]|uniref:Hsp90 co-chaperone cdc37-like 1 n=1 Tax=Limosa lapponica baueri TaxID=1758121 RepID=A0A2I0TIJ4_LIMLA|nr:hsp90 co-chaperone cdc37-like 1 [Limosa lapponica baueri]